MRVLLGKFTTQRVWRSARSWYVSMLGEKERFEAAVFECLSQFVGANSKIGRKYHNTILHGLLLIFQSSVRQAIDAANFIPTGGKRPSSDRNCQLGDYSEPH